MKIYLSLTVADGMPVEEAVDAEISSFDAYFRTLQTDGIGTTGPERAILKTFCAYLSGIGPRNPRAGKGSTNVT